jgi:RimJ/RimL family protein N-acetyltransferase
MTLPIDFGIGRLRRLHLDDLAAFQAYRAIPELGRYQGWTPMPGHEAVAFLTRMHEKPLLQRGEWIQLGIADRATDELIGDIGIYLSDDGAGAEIGFTLAPPSQGRGIATAAVRAAVQLIFDSTPVRQVTGMTDTRNLASARLLERAGFTWRHDREALFHDQPCTEKVYTFERP